MADKKEDPSKFNCQYYSSILFSFTIEKVAEETPGAAGGLDDDDVWGDVEDVSGF